MTSRLIAAAARSRLRPLGLRQKGQSRLWYDDRGWSLIIVEFQPGRGPGTYLNVGAMWLWPERDVWAFDEGGRLYWRDDGSFTFKQPLGEPGWTQHLDFLNTDHFVRDIALVARVAAARVTELRTQFPDVGAVAEHLTSRKPGFGQSPLWHAFHGGAAAVLSGDMTAAGQSLQKAVATDPDTDWEHDLVARASELLNLFDDPVALRSRLVECIGRSRQQLKLPAVDFDHDESGDFSSSKP